MVIWSVTGKYKCQISTRMYIGLVHMAKIFGRGDKQKASGFYGLSNTKKGIRSTFNATLKQNLKRMGVKKKG